MEETVRAAVPAFVNVTICAALAVPTFAEAKVRLVDESVTDGAVATPVPERVTVWGEPVALSITERAPVRVPVAEGVKVTEMAQLPPAARLVPQFWLAAKSPDVAREVKLRAAFPELVNVTICATLVAPTFVDAKVKLVGESAAVGAVAMPVPESATVWGAPVALSATLNVPVRVPAAEGVKVTEIAQLPPPAMLVPQF
jgi:hypothetical protein